MAAYPQAGDSFGPYDVVRAIGRGGMGVVYAAVHRGLRRDVALKLLSHELASAEDYRRRFAREAEILARLDSPHIIGVHDAGALDGTYYIATQLVPDGDLGALLDARGPLPAELALDLVGQVADGLAAAHAAGVLHRDIKPSNVLVEHRPTGLHAVLCDLGISVAVDAEHTKTAGVIGTLGYLAPERHDGGPATVASDVYAVGCLLWAMVTGSAPYLGTDVRVAMAHLYDPIPQLAARTAAQARVNQVVLRAMAKHPQARHASAADLRAAARAPLDATPPPGRAARTAAPSPAPLPAPLPAPSPAPSRAPTLPSSPRPPVLAPPPPRRAGRRRTAVVAVVAAALAVVLVGVLLGVRDDDPAGREASSSTPDVGPDDEATEVAAPTPVLGGDPDLEVVRADPTRFDGPATDVPGAVRGGTLAVSSTLPGPDELDPANAYGGPGGAVMQALLTRSLTQFARNPQTGGMELVPDLATDLGTPNEDFTEWRFTLRDGVRWEDGSEVTADELAFGISRSLDTTRFPDGPGSVWSTPYFEGGDDYGGPYTSGTPYAGIEVDGDTIVIRMSRPFPEMDMYGTMPAMGPAPLGDASAPDRYARRPLATGPYRLADFVPGKTVVLVRNDAWDPASDPGRHAYPDRFEFRFGVGPTDAAQQTVRDEVALSVGLDPAGYASLRERLGARLDTATMPCTSYLSPDWESTGGGSVAGELVRQAIALGYDRLGALRAAGERPGATRLPTGSLLPPGTIGRTDRGPVAFDPARARALLSQAGYGGGANLRFELRMTFDSTNPRDTAVQRVIDAGFEQAGFAVDSVPHAGATWDVHVGGAAPALDDSLALRRFVWCSDWPSASSVLPRLLRSDSAFNIGGFRDAAFDDSLDAVSSLPSSEQPDAWSALEQEALDTTALLPSAVSVSLNGRGSELAGYANDITTGYPAYEDLYLVE